MTGDLMTFSVHLLDDVDPVLIDCALADVVASYEESSFEPSVLEQLEHSLSEGVWSIIVGDGNSTIIGAGVYTFTSVWNHTLLGASVVAGCWSARCLVSITSGTKVEQTIRSCAVL